VAPSAQDVILRSSATTTVTKPVITSGDQQPVITNITSLPVDPSRRPIALTPPPPSLKDRLVPLPQQRHVTGPYQKAAAKEKTLIPIVPKSPVLLSLVLEGEENDSEASDSIDGSVRRTDDPVQRIMRDAQEKRRQGLLIATRAEVNKKRRDQLHTVQAVLRKSLVEISDARLVSLAHSPANQEHQGRIIFTKRAIMSQVVNRDIVNPKSNQKPTMARDRGSDK
jgi:hypothetical protein